MQIILLSTHVFHRYKTELISYSPVIYAVLLQREHSQRLCLPYFKKQCLRIINTQLWAINN